MCGKIMSKLVPDQKRRLIGNLLVHLHLVCPLYETHIVSELFTANQSNIYQKILCIGHDLS